MAKDRQGLLRRGWEWLSHIHLAGWLWTLIVSALNGIGAGYAAWWAWATQWGYVPVYVVALITFAATLWIINAVIWLRGQRRPSRARISFNYSFGLALEDVILSYDKDNIANMLEVRLKIRNHADGPIKYIVEEFHTTIEDRFWNILSPISGVLPRIAGITIFPGGGFNKEAFNNFKDRTTGTLKYSIIYGHPEEDVMSRRATKVLALQIFKKTDNNGGISVNIIWTIVSDLDVSI